MVAPISQVAPLATRYAGMPIPNPGPRGLPSFVKTSPRRVASILVLLIGVVSLAGAGAASSPAFAGPFGAFRRALEEDARTPPVRSTEHIGSLDNAMSAECLIQQHRREVAAAPILIEDVSRDIFCPPWPLRAPLPPFDR